jgi:hypothetical protein
MNRTRDRREGICCDCLMTNYMKAPNENWEHIADAARTAMERMSTTKNEKRARKQTERKYYSAERERRHSSAQRVREK